MSVMQLLPTFAVVSVLLATGLVHGVLTERWTPPQDLASAVEKLEHLPDKVGDWEGEPLQTHHGKVPGIAGAVTRRYVHRLTDASVTVYLACGRGGPVSIHTPDVCYAAGGYRVDPETAISCAKRPGLAGAQFLTTNMRKQGTADLRVFWSWHCRERWVTADSPRFAFARQPLLYKLYLIRELTSPPGPRALLDAVDGYMRRELVVVEIKADPEVLARCTCALVVMAIAIFVGVVL